MAGHERIGTPGRGYIAQYAAYRGCSAAAVWKALKKGRIARDADGKITFTTADVDWAKNTAQLRRPPGRPPRLPNSLVAPATGLVPGPTAAECDVRLGPTPEPPGVAPDVSAEIAASGETAVAEPVEIADPARRITYNDAKTVRETYMARLARLEFERRQGKYLDAAEVKSAAIAEGRRFRESMMNIPDRVAARLEAETGGRVPAAHIRAILAEEIRHAITEHINIGDSALRIDRAVKAG